MTELDIEWKIASIDNYLSVFRAWANMDALPQSVQTAVEATVRENAKGLAVDGTLVIPNPAVLISASK